MTDDDMVWVEHEPEANQDRYSLFQDEVPLDCLLCGFSLAILLGIIFSMASGLR